LKIALIGKVGHFPCKELLAFQKAGHNVLYTGIDNRLALSAGVLPGVRHVVTNSNVIVILSNAFFSTHGELETTLLLKLLWTIATCISGYKLIILDNQFPEGLSRHVRSFLYNNLTDTTTRFDIAPSTGISSKGASLIKELQNLNILSCLN